MARPERNNIDYFPFFCEDGKKMFYIEETYGNDGFATFIKILRELAKTDYHYLDLSKNTTLMFISAKCKISKELLISIVNDLVDLGKFNEVLWTENKIIWCQDFIDSIQDAYKKRNNKCITFEGLLLLLEGLGVRKPIKSTSTAPVKPQSKLKENKVDKIKGNNSTPEPTVSVQDSTFIYNEVKDFFNDMYLECYKTKYVFSAKDAAKVKSIIKKVHFKMKEKDGREDFTESELTNATKFFIQAANTVADKWLKSNMSLSNIDSKFNEIYSSIKNPNNGITKTKQRSIFAD